MDFKRLMEGKAQVETESEREIDEKESMVGGWQEEKCLGGPDEGWGWPAGRLGSPGPRISLWT